MHPRDLLAAYEDGQNITELLRGDLQSEVNTEEIIEVAYDLQSGSYIAGLDDDDFRQHKIEYGAAIADQILQLAGEGLSVLEPGIGEGTTLAYVLKAQRNAFRSAHGFDISWSRVAKCREWLATQGFGDTFLSVASIFHTPYADNAFDVVYTSHTIEPNGGSEPAILQELYRIASRYLILLEPGYEFATPEAQERMQRLGYVRELKQHATSLGMDVLRHEPFPVTANPMNPTAITVIEKNADAVNGLPRLACPRYGDELESHADSYFSPESLRAYPKILGLPCLRIEDGVVASKYADIAGGQA